MPDSHEFSLDALADDEALMNSLALSAGMRASLDYLLTRLAGYHSLLELELEDNPTGNVYLTGSNSTIRSARHLIGIYDQLLPDSEGNFEAIDIAVLSASVVDRLQKIERAEIQLHLPEGETSLSVWGDLPLLQAILFHLPLVLIQPTDRGPVHMHLTIGRSSIDDAWAKSRSGNLSPGDYYSITVDLHQEEPVDDELVSILEKQVVTPEFVINERLLYVFGAVLQHAGDICCRKGHNFVHSLTVLLPVYESQGGMYKGASLEQAELRGNETILLVDDEAIIWDVVIDMLQSLGYTVILASDGRECVEVYRENPGKIDLVLLDMIMPEMNGYDAYFALRDIQADVRVLLSSGYVKEADAQDVLAAGAAGFLKKPYRLVDLAQKIREVLQGGT
ncbi:MAG: CheY-like chemotaxis protein [Rhodothermales bacterium]|jgi:CheY-like chemotaxis protein